jgi:hypothetical protein
VSTPRTVDAREIHAGPIGQQLAQIKLDAPLGARARRSAQIDPGAGQRLHWRPQLVVAVAQVALDVVIHGQRLRQHEQMLLAPVALQRTRDLVLAGLDTPVSAAGNTCALRSPATMARMTETPLQRSTR